MADKSITISDNAIGQEAISLSIKISQVESKCGKAIYFDGVNDYVDCGSITQYESFSISIWVNPTANPNQTNSSYLSVYSGLDSNLRFNIAPNSLYNHVRWRLPDGDYVDYQLSNNGSLNQWAHYVITYDGVNDILKGYKNGQLQYTYNTEIYSNFGHNVKIGMNGVNNWYFTGLIDEVRIYNRALSAKEATEQYKGIFNNETGLIGLWHFDEGSGSTAYDSSGNGNNGTLIGGPIWTESTVPLSAIGTDVVNYTLKSILIVESKYGNALSFDGVNDYVNIGKGASLNPGLGSWTVEGWIFNRDYTYPKTQIPIGGYNTYSGAHWCINNGFNSNGITVDWSDGTNYLTQGLIAFDSGYKPNDTKNKWTHIVVVFDRTAGKAYGYVNGVKQSGSADISSITGNITNPNNNIGNVAGWKIDGLIDEVRIYNRALSAEEIMEHYKGIFTNETGLVGLWHFDEGSGSTAYDSSGKGNNGTFIGGPTWVQSSIPLSATGIDSIFEKVRVNTLDSGTGNDLVKIVGNLIITDSAFANDIIKSVIKLSQQDSATGQDATQFLIKLSQSDSAVGNEIIKILNSIILSDIGNSDEAIKILCFIALSDNISSSEVIQALNELSLSDNGIGLDDIAIKKIVRIYRKVKTLLNKQNKSTILNKNKTLKI